MSDVPTSEGPAPERPFWVSPAIVLFAYGAALIVAVLRWPAFVWAPQFWAEDGTIWFQQAYTLGARPSLAMPYAGYFQLFPRLAGVLAASSGIARAPAVLNGLALLAYGLPVPLVLLLAKSRKELGFLAAVATWSVVRPYSWEVRLGVTNAIWSLSLCLVCAALLKSTRQLTPWMDRFASLVILVAGLSGPFSLLLLLCILPFAWIHRRSPAPRRRSAVVALLAACTGVQVVIAFNSDRIGGTAHSLPSASALVRIVGGQIVAGGVLGEHAARYLYSTHNSALYVACAAFYVAVIARGWRVADQRGRVYIAFAQLVLMASILFPASSPGTDGLAQLQMPASGLRYWLHPTLAFALCLLFMLAARSGPLDTVVPLALLPLAAIGVVSDFRTAPLADMGYAVRVTDYCALPEGAEMSIPIHPPGWRIELRRRQDSSCP